MQFDPGLDFRDMCLYNEPRMNRVVIHFCFSFFVFVPHPIKGIKVMECCQSYPKVNRPLNQIILD